MILKTDAMMIPAGGVLSPGCLRIEDGCIAEIGESLSAAGERVVDFRGRVGGDRLAVVLPGFIDAHCHLELSGLSGKIVFRSGQTLIDWLMKIVLYMPKRQATQERWVRLGADQALTSGTTTVADISANNQSWRALVDHPIRKVCFAEVIGFGPKAETAVEGLERRMADMPGEDGRFFKGVSPHAPYSTAEKVYRGAMDLAERNTWRIMTHLAEDRTELQFLRNGGGGWRPVLKAIGVWDGSFTGTGLTPIEWADEIGLLDRKALLAHANYVTDRDIELLARGQATVVYCPLAHRYFRHGPHAYRDMIDAGVNVALGCDSLACSPSLSMLDQMRAVYWAGGLEPETVLALATENAAKGLNHSHRIGSLEAGKAADLVVMGMTREAGEDIAEGIFHPESRVSAVMCGGEFVTGGTMVL